MRDKLIELIVNGENELFRQRNYFTDMERIEHTADYLIAHGVTIQEWIPVSEKLPKNGEIVLCKTRFCIAVRHNLFCELLYWLKRRKHEHISHNNDHSACGNSGHQDNSERYSASQAKQNDKATAQGR